MRTKYFTLAVVVSALLLVLAASTVYAIDRNVDAVKTASAAQVAVMPQPEVAARPVGGPRTVQDFRDSAALVLVGSMLIGLAAAVRRTV